LKPLVAVVTVSSKPEHGFRAPESHGDHSFFAGV